MEVKNNPITDEKSVQTQNVESKESSLTFINEDIIKDNSIPSLKRLNTSFMYEFMSIPTASHNEHRMVTFIMLWAIKNGINYQFDDYGNIYLTKGEVGENEFYPCVTAHMDTVQDKQNAFAKCGYSLEVKTRPGKKHGMFDHTGQNEIYVEGFGIGGDDKAGVLICLQMFSYVNKLKACFFLEEEVGCIGSNHLDKEWFKNVGYVLGFDSPELNRAAYCCNGTPLMNEKFFKDNKLDELCASYGLNDFRAEPFTDVVQIRKQTEIICMNFGTGYYECHMPTEYCVVEDMDNALDMGIAIIERLGLNEFKMQATTTYYGAKDKYFEKLNPNYKELVTTNYGGYGGSYNYSGYTGGSGSTVYSQGSGSTVANTSTTGTKDNSKDNYEMVEHVSLVYEKHIKDIEETIKAKCTEMGVDFGKFEEIFNKKLIF